jgi:hypothetical protein
MDDLLTLHPDGLFLRREALAHGYDDRDLRAAMRAGVLTRVRQGAYVDAASWSSAGPVERYRTLGRAVLLSHPRGSVALSHTSAVVEHGLDTWNANLSLVHVTRLDGGQAHAGAGVRYHAGRALDDLVQTPAGPTMSAGRAALEYAALHPVEQGLVVLDAALHSGATTLEDLQRLREGMLRWPHTSRLQITLRLAEPGAESVGESRARYLCWREHLPKPVLQFEVRDGEGRLVGRTDFAWPDHGLLGEFDGRLKYGRLLTRGQDATDVLFAEKRREDLLREITGWLMIRLIWGDLARPHQTAERIREQLTRGRRTAHLSW